MKYEDIRERQVTRECENEDKAAENNHSTFRMRLPETWSRLR